GPAYAAGQPMPAGLSAKALFLAQGMSKALLATRTTLATALALALGLLGAGAAAWWQRHTSPEGPTTPTPKVAEKAERPAPAALPVDAKPDAAGRVTLSGTVLDPDGKPARGAKVSFWTGGKAGPQAETGADGRFRLEVERDKIEGGTQLIAS